jgi:hypothetical protein
MIVKAEALDVRQSAAQYEVLRALRLSQCTSYFFASDTNRGHKVTSSPGADTNQSPLWPLPLP